MHGSANELQPNFIHGRRLPAKSCVKKLFIVYFEAAYLIKLAYNIKTSGGYYDEMGNTKLHRPAFRFRSNNVYL